MRVVLLVLTLVLVGASAEAQNLCDPRWLETASGGDVRALLRGGADVKPDLQRQSEPPLHQAILTAGNVSPGVVRALVEAGADILAENIDGSSPLDYAELRFARAERQFQPGSGPYRREETIYLAVNRGFEAGSAAADAHSQLCDLDWWRSSASGRRWRRCFGPRSGPQHGLQLQQRPADSPAVEVDVLHPPARGGSDGDRSACRCRRGSGSRQSALGLVEIRMDRVRDRHGWNNNQSLGYAPLEESTIGNPFESP